MLVQLLTGVTQFGTEILELGPERALAGSGTELTWLNGEIALGERRSIVIAAPAGNLTGRLSPSARIPEAVCDSLVAGLNIEPLYRGNAMTRAVTGLIALLSALLPSPWALAQRPSDPALLEPEIAPELEYVLAPNAFLLPEGVGMGAPASVAFDADGHLFVLTRGDTTFFEFDADGRFVRAFGDKLFVRAHGLHIDSRGNLWATDVSGHVVVKLDRNGNELLTIGTRGEAGEWDEATGSHKLNQPNDVVVADNGDIFVVQGHRPGFEGDARVLKFGPDGTFVTSWGGKGIAPGQFQVAHGIDIDAAGNLWVSDRENQRVQIFQPDGTFVREMYYRGLPCDVVIGPEHVYMVNGFAGQVLQLDLEGRVLAAMGRPGAGPGEFGEAHMIATNDREEIFVADSVNAKLMKFVPR
jgi:sugar lactone lactonase YvrE